MDKTLIVIVLVAILGGGLYLYQRGATPALAPANTDVGAPDIPSSYQGTQPSTQPATKVAPSTKSFTISGQNYSLTDRKSVV